MSQPWCWISLTIWLTIWLNYLIDHSALDRPSSSKNRLAIINLRRGPTEPATGLSILSLKGGIYQPWSLWIRPEAKDKWLWSMCHTHTKRTNAVRQKMAGPFVTLRWLEEFWIRGWIPKSRTFKILKAWRQGTLAGIAVAQYRFPAFERFFSIASKCFDYRFCFKSRLIHL